MLQIFGEKEMVPASSSKMIILLCMNFDISVLWF